MSTRSRLAYAVGLAALGLSSCERQAEQTPPRQAQTPTAQANASYEGFWEVVGRPDSGLGSALEILPEGKCKWGILAIVDSGYELQNGSIVLTTGDKRASIPIGEIEGDTWTMQQGEERLVRTRVGDGEADNQILGVWTYRHYTGATAYERYSKDGLMELRVPITWQTKQWNVDSSTGKCSFQDVPDKGDVSMGWLDGENLHVDVKNDELLIFRRVPPWYAKKD